MVEDKGPVVSVGRFLFPAIFRSFRLSIQPSKLVLAFAAVAAICLAGRIMDLSQTVVMHGAYSMAGRQGDFTGFLRSDGSTELDVYIISPAKLDDFVAAHGKGPHVGVFHALRRFGSEQFHHALYSIFALDSAGFLGSVANGVRALIWAFRRHTVYSIIFFAVVLAILALTGGAICRMAALPFARGQRLGLRQAARFGRRRFVSLLVAPLIPFAVVIILGLLFITLVGLIGSIPVVGELLASLLLPVSLIAGFVIAGGLIGTIPGLNLMFPAVAFEDSDSFDAISRSLSSVYNKPWHMGFYTLLAVVYGAVCYVFVRFFAFLLLWTTHQFLQLGFLSNAKLGQIWAEPTFTELLGPVMQAAPDTWSLWIAWWLVRVWGFAVAGMVAAFVISFYFSANTVIYALMRNRVDGTPLNEVYVRPEETTVEPSPPEILPEETAPAPEAKPS